MRKLKKAMDGFKSWLKENTKKGDILDCVATSNMIIYTKRFSQNEVVFAMKYKKSKSKKVK